MSTLARDLKALVGADAVLDPPPAALPQRRDRGARPRGHARRGRAPGDAGRGRRGRRVVLRARRRDRAARRRQRLRGRCRAGHGGVVLDLGRMKRVRAASTRCSGGSRSRPAYAPRELRRLARESGLCFPPDPGAAEQSQIGGNIATNAGGPHAFKYGVTGAWVTGLEAVVAAGRADPRRRRGAQGRRRLRPQEPADRLGGHARDHHRRVAAAHARAGGRAPVVARLPRHGAGCRGASRRCSETACRSAALEYLDGRHARSSPSGAFPVRLPAGAGFMVIAEADGSARGAAAERDALRGGAGRGALAVHAPATPARSPRSGAGATASRSPSRAHARRQALRGHRRPARPARRGDRRHDRDRRAPRAGRVQLGPRRRRQPALELPHRPRRPGAARRAPARPPRSSSQLAGRLGGSISGEHGVGWAKRGHLGPSVGARRRRPAPRDQAGLRPQEPHEPRQEDVIRAGCELCWM